MDKKRITTGRLAKVEERRRVNKMRWVFGITAAVLLVFLVVLAVNYRNMFFEKGAEPGPMVEEPTPGEPRETRPAETAPPETGLVPKVLVVNNTVVPQRFGNALAAIENYNVKNEGVFRIDSIKPEIAYSGGTVVLYRPGYEEYAASIAEVLGGFPTVQADITMVCGQDISELILEAFVKEGPLTEEIRLEVLNGCGLEGAAAKVKERLESNGYTVVAIGNADNFDYGKTVLYTAEGQEEKARKVIGLFGMEENTIKKPDYDIKVVVADDFVS